MNPQIAALRNIIYGAVNHGADLHKICADLGIEPGDLNDSDKQITEEQRGKLWKVLLHHTNDPLLGLHLGEHINPTIHGMLGYLMQSCRTVYESTMKLCQYNELLTPAMRFSVELSSSEFSILYQPSASWQNIDPEGARQSIEIGMSGALAITKTVTGKKVYPTKIDLAFPPRAVSEYERVFKSVINFNRKENRLFFSRDVALLPILTYDKSLFDFFDKTLENMLKSLGSNELLSDRIKRLILSEFKGETPNIEIIAARLNITTRSLQRKLKEDKTNYREVITEIKKHLAQNMMNADFRMGEVAEVLGYADSSAFRKAFKKWSLA